MTSPMRKPRFFLRTLSSPARYSVDHVGVGGEHARRRPRRARRRRSPARARARRRPASVASARCRHSPSTSLAWLREIVPAATRPTSSASPSGASGSTSGDSPDLVEVAEHLAVGPVDDVAAPNRRRARRRPPPRTRRGPGVPTSDPRLGVADPPLAPRSRARRVGRQLGHRPAHPRRASRRSARPARGRARGSSGSRTSPPWCASSACARRLRPSAASPARCARRSRARSIWRSISYSIARPSERSEFMFLTSTLVPSSDVPTGRTDTLASTRIEPSSIFTSETPIACSTARSSRHVRARLLGAADVGPAHDLHQRHAGAVVVDERVVGLVDATAAADVRRSCRCPPRGARARCRRGRRRRRSSRRS